MWLQRRIRPFRPDPPTPWQQRRPLGDRGFAILALSAGLLVLVILVLIAITTSQQASSWFSTEGLKIFSNNWNPAANQFGVLAFIYGTAVTAVIAVIISVPVSIGIALLLTEVVPRRLGQPIVYVVDLLAVVPSVVWGLWGILVFAPWVQHIYTSIASGVNGVPVLGFLFGGQNISGASFFTCRPHPGLHDHADRDLAVPRGDRDDAVHRQAGRLRARRHPVGDDPRRRPGRTARAASSGPCCSAWDGRWARRSRRRS